MDGALILNYAHEGRKQNIRKMTKTSIRENRNANKLDSKNKLTHIANRSCALPSFGEEEQKLSHVEGPPIERCTLTQAHEGGGGWT